MKTIKPNALLVLCCSGPVVLMWVGCIIWDYFTGLGDADCVSIKECMIRNPGEGFMLMVLKW